VTAQQRLATGETCERNWKKNERCHSINWSMWNLLVQVRLLGAIHEWVFGSCKGMGMLARAIERITPPNKSVSAK
jgi:hypothetical protein